MRKIILILLTNISLAGICQTPTTNWELGIQLGTSYYLGELNSQHFQPIQPAGGILVRYNYDSRVSFRSSVNYGLISGSDDNINGSYSDVRNISFQNDVLEAAFVVEFNFYEFSTFAISDFSSETSIFTPYVYMGLAYFYHNPEINVGDGFRQAANNNVESKNYSLHQMSIPLGIGLKFRSKGFGIGIDWGIRRTFTDYIDDISSFYQGDSEASTPVGLSDYQRGELFNNDWYIFTGITLFVNLTKRSSCRN